MRTIAGGLFALLAMTVAAQADSTMFKGNPALTGVVEAPTPAALKGIRFTFRTQGLIRGTPALVAGVLYFGSSDGNFYAVDAATGAERWRVPTGIVNSSPSVADGIVTFTGRDGTLVALAVADGAKRWSVAFGKDLGAMNYWDYYTSSPIPFADLLYVGSGDGHLYAVDRASGRVRWRFDAKARVRSTPAVTDSVVVFATAAGKVFALDRATGKQRWVFATKGATNTFAMKDNDTTSIFASPTIDGGIVTIGGRDAFLYGIDLATGKQKWRITHDGDSWILGTAMQNGIVYSASGSANFVQSANAATGAENWRAPSSGAIFGTPAIAGDAVLFEDFAGDLHAVDKDKGSELWRFPMGARSFGTPVIGPDGTVYAASDNGTLYALNTSTTPAGTTPTKKYVYWEGKKTKDAQTYFSNRIAAANLEYFKASGYEQIDEAGFRKIIADQQSGKTRSVIVFADNLARVALFDTATADAPIRKYLDAGGRVVFLGTNPLAFKYDPQTGDITAYDYARVERILGLRYPPRTADSGYNINVPTDDGRAWGLQGVQIVNGAIDPKEASIVLTRDEFGMAGAWVKTYGRGGALVQLQVPRDNTPDLTQYRLVIEHGL